MTRPVTKKRVATRLGKTALVLGGGTVLAGLVGGSVYGAQQARHHAQVMTEVATIVPSHYAAQKVVYHITDEEGLFTHRYWSRIGTLRNHLKAVGPDRLQVRVVLQGPGIGLLRKAAGNAHMQSEIDALRAAGVRFLVCRNSLVEQDVAPTELYGVGQDDIVGAAVAELAALQADGYVYLRM